MNGERIAGFLSIRLIRYDERGLANPRLMKGPTPMKTLTITLPDEIYAAAEKAAGNRGLTLSSEIASLIAHSVRPEESNGEKVVATEANPTELFAALDRGRQCRAGGQIATRGAL